MRQSSETPREVQQALSPPEETSADLLEALGALRTGQMGLLAFLPSIFRILSVFCLVPFLIQWICYNLLKHHHIDQENILQMLYDSKQYV